MKKNKSLVCALMALTLGGCAAGPDYMSPKHNFIDQWFSAGNEYSSSEKIQTQWWKIFNDPLLEHYIVGASRHNKDIQIALANVRQARALRREAGGAFLPDVAAGAGAERSKASTGSIANNYDAGFDASWEIDIFGGTRRAVEAAGARVGSAQANYQDVMLTTLSEVARTYYEARGLQKRIANTQKNADLLGETFSVIEDRMAAGETSGFDLSRARGEYESIRARIPNLEADLKAAVYTLSVLLGRPPEALLEEMERVQPLPAPPDLVPVGLRSDILRRRPDVRMAELELAASVADIGVETSELFPKFFLTGDIGSAASVFGDIFSTGSGVWSLAAIVQWSVFEGGAIRARIEAAEAESEAAFLAYEKSVLEALRDAETALIRYGKELETRKRLEESVRSLRQSASLARDLFDVGEADYLAVVDAERQLIAGEDNLVISETATLTKLIALYTALGGGWQEPEISEEK